MGQMYVSAIRQAIARIMQLTSDILSLEPAEYREVTLMRVQLAKLLGTMDNLQKTVATASKK